MFDLFFAMLAASMNGAPAADGAGAPAVAATPPAQVQTAPSTETAQILPAPTLPTVPTAPTAPAVAAPAPQPAAPAPQPAAPQPTQAAPATATFDMSVVPQGLVPDPQVPSGKFTTAAEVKPILTATKANWVVLRPYEGKDWLYITHLWSWRCGLKAIAISLNNEPMQNWPMPG